MKKKMMIGIGIVVIVVIAVILWISLSRDLGNLESSGTEPSPSSSESAKSLSEEGKKLAEFEAEQACNFMNVAETGEFEKAAEEAESRMIEYGYTEEQYEELKLRYHENEGYRNYLYSELEENCPSIMPPEE